MIVVSVICEQVDLGLTRFIRSLSKNKKIIVGTVIVAPKYELHPLRIKQMSIRKDISESSGLRKTRSLTSLFGLFLDKIFLKQVVVKLLISVKKYNLGFKVVQANDDWLFSEMSIYNDVAVIYSFEGLLTECVITKFRKGIINIHPAILPQYRGLDGGLWALYEGGMLGVTAYKIDKGIDTGPIIRTFKLKKDGLSLTNYIEDLKNLKYESYVESIQDLDSGVFENIDPRIDRMQNRGVMPRKLIEEIIKRSAIG